MSELPAAMDNFDKEHNNNEEMSGHKASGQETTTDEMEKWRRLQRKVERESNRKEEIYQPSREAELQARADQEVRWKE